MPAFFAYFLLICGERCNFTATKRMTNYMSLKRVFISVVAMLLCCVVAMALNLPIKRVNGKVYYYYTVQKNEFIYELPVKMGLPRKDILKYNPNAAEGLQAGMVLTIPVEYDAKIKKGYYVIQYKAGSHETIYGIAKKYGVPVDRLIDFNPGAAEGVRGLTLEIPVSMAANKKPVVKNEEAKPVQKADTVAVDSAKVVPVTPVVPDGMRSYVIKPGETLESIASENGLSEIDILRANPSLAISEFVEGQMIYLPIDNSLVDSEKRIGGRVEEIDSSDVVIDSAEVSVDSLSCSDLDEKVIKIALALPFDLNSEKESKHAQIYTEFYRGFLMGVEKLSHEGEKVEILAYDSSVSEDSVAMCLNEKPNVVITSDNIGQLDMMTEKAKTISPESVIFNLFAIKDTSYVDNSSVVQANIPSKYMYEQAANAFLEKYAGYVPVFIARIDGSADKAEFTQLLKSRLDAKGLEYKEIVFRNFLGKDNVEGLNTTDTAYVFVPTTGSRTEFLKFAPAIKTLRSSAVNPEHVAIFGYPEWIIFRGDYLDHLHGLNASIYSRFYTSSEDAGENAFKAEYETWYGREVMELVPSQAIMGYDTATFLIKYLRGELGENGFEGIQTGFNIVTPEGAQGFINNHLYMINFRPNGKVTKTIIK